MFQKLYGSLEIPWVYRFVSGLLTPGANRLLVPFFKRAFDRTVFCVLDMGCGPRVVIPEPAGLLVGVDINEDYVRKYTGGFVDQDVRWVASPPSGRRRLGFVISAAGLPFKDGSFDEVFTCAVFHHLRDEEVVKAIREMNRCLQSGGRIVVVDAVWPVHAWRRPLAWITLRLDRGGYVRSQEKLTALCEEACPGSWELFRQTYTYTGLEFLCLRQIKK